MYMAPAASASSAQDGAVRLSESFAIRCCSWMLRSTGLSTDMQLFNCAADCSASILLSSRHAQDLRLQGIQQVEHSQPLAMLARGALFWLLEVCWCRPACDEMKLNRSCPLTVRTPAAQHTAVGRAPGCPAPAGTPTSASASQIQAHTEIQSLKTMRKL